MARLPIPRSVLLAVLAYVVLVHGVAIWGEGRMTSPLKPSWDAEALAEAPPLARFDAGWFRSVAKEGYTWDRSTGVGNVMIFPLYPALWRVLSLSGLPLFWSGLILAHLFCLCALVLLYVHVKNGWGKDGWEGEESAGAAVIALLAFPWAFYLLAPYSESLFLALALGAFVAARRGRWSLVAALGFLAGLTRIFALALVPALLWVAWKESDGVSDRGPTGSRASRLAAGSAALTPPAGVAVFLTWLAVRFGDPLVYLHTQQAGWGRASGWAGLRRSLTLIIENIRQRGLLHLGPAVDLLVVLFLIVAAVWCFRRGAAAEGLYVGAGVVLILLSGGLLAAGRYALVLFPMVRPIVGLRRRRLVWYGYLAAALLLQAYLIVRFVNNLWVA